MNWKRLYLELAWQGVAGDGWDIGAANRKIKKAPRVGKETVTSVLLCSLTALDFMLIVSFLFRPGVDPTNTLVF